MYKSIHTQHLAPAQTLLLTQQLAHLHQEPGLGKPSDALERVLIDLHKCNQFQEELGHGTEWKQLLLLARGLASSPDSAGTQRVLVAVTDIADGPLSMLLQFLVLTHLISAWAAAHTPTPPSSSPAASTSSVLPSSIVTSSAAPATCARISAEAGAGPVRKSARIAQASPAGSASGALQPGASQAVADVGSIDLGAPDASKSSDSEDAARTGLEELIEWLTDEVTHAISTDLHHVSLACLQSLYQFAKGCTADERVLAAAAGICASLLGPAELAQDTIVLGALADRAQLAVTVPVWPIYRHSAVDTLRQWEPAGKVVKIRSNMVRAMMLIDEPGNFVGRFESTPMTFAVSSYQIALRIAFDTSASEAGHQGMFVSIKGATPSGKMPPVALKFSLGAISSGTRSTSEALFAWGFTLAIGHTVVENPSWASMDDLDLQFPKDMKLFCEVSW